MKILCVIDGLGSGGAQRQLVELAKGFKSKGHDVYFLVYYLQDFYKEDLDKAGISITSIIEPNYIKRLLRMRKFIRQGNYNSVLSFLGAANFITTVSGLPNKKWKLVVGERSANPNILKSFKLRSYRWFHLFTDFIVANSHANLELVKKANPLLSRRKLKVIYNTVSHSSFNYRIKNKREPLHIVVGASHRYLKNSLLMAKALNLLTELERSRLEISWFGDNISPPFFDGSFVETKKYIDANNLNKVINFYPASKNLIKQIEEADVVALFSAYEGLPNTICEALSLGKPVICPNISDIPLIIKDQEQLFKVNDVFDLKRVFKFYLNISDAEYQNIGLHNQKSSSELFCPDKIIGQYLELLT